MCIHFTDVSIPINITRFTLNVLIFAKQNHYIIIIYNFFYNIYIYIL